VKYPTLSQLPRIIGLGHGFNTYKGVEVEMRVGGISSMTPVIFVG